MTDTLIRNICGAACIAAAASCSTGEPSPYGALPSQAQIEWQKMETNMFCHLTADNGPQLPRLQA